MARSEKVAAAVALKQAGFKVGITNRGALVEAVATDVPAATKLDSGDVIVAARGRPSARRASSATRSRASSPATTSSSACGATARSRR